MKKLRIAIQMDPLERLSLAGDSTLYIARAAARRGYELFHYTPQRLTMEMRGKKRFITASGHTLKFKNADQASAHLDNPATRNLEDFDVVLMRQDPPFDLAYIAATHILELLKDKVCVVNDPIGVRNAPEKLLVTEFPQLMPPTLVTRDAAAIYDFQRKHGDIIFKPLFSNAGRGIFHIGKKDDNLPALVEMMSGVNAEPWMIQKYLPEIHTKGDKRIVLLGSDPVGVYTRIPQKGDARANMRVGATPRRSPLTKRDREICATIGPVLQTLGLFLAGIDVIGDYLTEINVTSPTGLGVSDRLAGRKGKDTIAEMFWDRLLK